MSCQRGNTSRTRKQKHSNITAFKNNIHDSSKQTLAMNNMEITEVCKRCQEVIAWKVKYKKYKPLSQPKTCTRCHQKNIKDAYHTVCNSCAKELQVCCKCGKKEDIIAHKPPSKTEHLQTMAELEAEVKCLSERKRRAYYRYLEKLEGKTKRRKKPNKSSEVESVTSEHENEEDEVAVSMDEYFKNARQKLEELMKEMEDDEFYEDLQDLNLNSEDESYDEEEEDSDEKEDS
ncbi:uncharacterized protein C9orf85 homolog isoform X2 [Portunus trituberculatus]|nr:uncharacterized protein C9orf85 homolog isoform X2 [Portunus trituberculatus]XP_045109894.1 uncharacterized protein C9orf85 homolog isoform X2 [Portunus trituberculatus]